MRNSDTKGAATHLAKKKWNIAPTSMNTTAPAAMYEFGSFLIPFTP